LSSLVSLDDPELRRSLEGRAVQFTSPAWSPSGDYVAAWINAIPGGSVPVVFGSDGRVVARGRGARWDPRNLMWMPRRDVLLYTPGVTNERKAYLKVYELDLLTGEERVFFRQKVSPQIIDVALSPSGRWIALFRGKSYANLRIQFEEVTGSEHVRDIRLPEETSFVDWGRAAPR
jgi:hypothetical protein